MKKREKNADHTQRQQSGNLRESIALSQTGRIETSAEVIDLLTKLSESPMQVLFVFDNKPKPISVSVHLFVPE